MFNIWAVFVGICFIHMVSKVAGRYKNAVYPSYFATFLQHIDRLNL